MAARTSWIRRPQQRFLALTCKYKYPEELGDLTPFEEKLISLNTAYGFITKFNLQRSHVEETKRPVEYIERYFSEERRCRG